VGEIDVERLQASLNRFTNRWLENVAPLIVDGEKGFLTNRRIMTGEVVSRLSGRARRQGYEQVRPPDAPPEGSALVVGEAGVARHPQAPPPAQTRDRGSRSAPGGFEVRRPPRGNMDAQVSGVGSRARLAGPARFGLALA
jgi:hypothetical protein